MHKSAILALLIAGKIDIVFLLRQFMEGSRVEDWAGASDLRGTQSST